MKVWIYSDESNHELEIFSNKKAAMEYFRNRQYDWWPYLKESYEKNEWEDWGDDEWIEFANGIDIFIGEMNVRDRGNN